MTNYQKSRIADMRAKGYGYSRIAASLGISANTVKSFCQRTGIQHIKEVPQDGCPYCGQPLVSKTKPKRFCSEQCRFNWWNAHRNEMARKSTCTVICNHCNVPFECYGGANRKYCSHNCYISARYRKTS